MNKTITNIEVKKKNRNRIYRYLCKSGVVSNPDISYELKLSLPTVTQNTKELIEMGLVKETGELESTGGRKAKGLSVAADARLSLGLDITRNHLGLLMTNLTGEILKYERVYFPFSNSPEYFQSVQAKLERFLDDSGAERSYILGIGISVPGIVDLEKGAITDSHALNLKALSFQEIEKFFQYPCTFLNDANAGAYAEGIQAEENEKFFYISLSNTVGGAFFCDGKLMYGSEFRCGEVGHMTIMPDGLPCYCGKKGCLDSYCTARRLSNFGDGKLEGFFQKLRLGDQEAAALWEEYIKYLAIAVNNIHMILDCDVVLGGYVGSYLEEYIPMIRSKAAERNTFSETGAFIKKCNYKIGAAALGAALYVAELFIEQI